MAYPISLSFFVRNYIIEIFMFNEPSIEISDSEQLEMS